MDEEDKGNVLSQKFKKPLLIGKVGKFPKKLVKSNDSKEVADVQNVDVDEKTEENELNDEVKKPVEKIVVEKQNLALCYKEPEWSSLPESNGKDYILEVLKNGQIVQTINLMDKAFWVFGRLDSCDIPMAHPTISRYHAVLQYKNQDSEEQPKGFYLYDLNSTHSTFLNKRKLKSRVYVKIYVGHMIKLGCSTRTYLLTGPAEDSEEESELTVTELKQKRQEELIRIKQEKEDVIQRAKEAEETLAKKIEERGVDWGMGEDADEEEDLAENPYAQTNNEELYLDDPKKALRGFMEREGHDLEYDCNEQGPGQFLCKVQLPLDDELGRAIVAEVLHKGKKKEAVIQCALEACRILDRHGVLRQATHESRKRKAKNWEEDDFYDSDDDVFLDRTGTIEKKREIRMKIKVPQQPETYQTLVEKENKIRDEINEKEKQLVNARNSRHFQNKNAEEDSLDSFMKELKQSNNLDKEKISKLKSDLQKLKQERANIIKLMGIAKPTNLPALVSQNEKNSNPAKQNKAKLPIFGKRLKVKINLPARPPKEVFDTNDDREKLMDVEDETKVDGNDDNKDNLIQIKNDKSRTIKTTSKSEEPATDTEQDPKEKDVTPKMHNIIPKKKPNDFIKDWNKLETNFYKIYPLMPHNHEHFVSNIWKHLKRLHPEYTEDVKQEVLDLIQEYVSESIGLVGDKFPNEVDFITSGIKLAQNGEDISKIAAKFLYLSKEVTHLVNEQERRRVVSDPRDSDEDAEDQKKIKQKGTDAKKQKRTTYRDDYSMWVPPEGQTGDGRTSLNDKYGY